MAVPIAPTLDSVVTEGLRQAGYPNPTTPLKTRAQNEWIEELKIKIASISQWTLFESTKTIIPSVNEQRIADPTDFQSMIDINFYDGATKGTMQAATINTVTLATGDGNNSHVGRLIFVTSGNAKAQRSRITAVSGDVVTISPDWSTTPSSGNYMVADHEHPLSFIPKSQIIKTSNSTGYPYFIAYYGGEFYLNNIPDKATYAITLDFYIKIQQLDLNDTTHATLLSSWQTALKLGVEYKALKEIKSPEWRNIKKEFMEEILILKNMDDKRNNPDYLISESAF